MIKKPLVQAIEKAIISLQSREIISPVFDIPEIEVEIPPESKLGDYSTNIILKIARKQSKDPHDLAWQLINRIKEQKTPFLDRIEFASPGFVNFFLSKKWLISKIDQVIENGKDFGKQDIGKKQKVMVEFISANPTGPLTVANGRGGFTGDVLANILSTVGFDVTREYYINDQGNQIDILGESVSRRYFQQHGFNVPYPEKCYQGDYIADIAKKIVIRNYRLSDNSKLEYIRDKVKVLALEKMLAQIKEVVVKKAKIKMDSWFSERSLYEDGSVDKALEFLKEKNLLYRHEDALWMKTSQFGDDKDRVLIKGDENPTYFMSDVAYHWHKFCFRKFQRVINILGADHHGYIGRLKAAVAAMGVDPEQLDILLVQFMRLVEDGREVKMSKRKGTFITMEDLVDEVGLDAVRFFFIMHAAATHMDFNIKLAKEKSAKNPVYYVQYAHARICSIIREAKEGKAKTKKSAPLLDHPKEMELLKMIIRYEDVLAETAKSYEIHRLAFYAVELAKSFHDFYTQCRVIGESGVNPHRLALINCTQVVLQNVLTVIGVKAPKRM